MSRPEGPCVPPPGSLQNGADAHNAGAQLASNTPLANSTHDVTGAPQARSRPAEESCPTLAAALADIARIEPRSLATVLDPGCESEVPLGAEEEIELDALMSRLGAAASAGAQSDIASRARGGLPLNPLHALSFWLMKCRAGQVKELDFARRTAWAEFLAAHPGEGR